MCIHKMSIEDPFADICVLNKMENLNLKVLNMIKVINESKALIKNISYVSLMVRNVTRDKNGTMISVIKGQFF